MKKLCCRCHAKPRAKNGGYCKDCWNAYQRAYAHTPKGRILRQDYWRRWYRKPRNRASVLRRSRKDYWADHAAQLTRHREYARTHRTEKLRKRNVAHAQVKAAVMNHYGPTCRCCGEARAEFLSIDHINGGGNAHRKKVGGGSRFYAWLKRHHFPPGYRVLCYNCNQSFGFYGYCPHQRHK